MTNVVLQHNDALVVCCAYLKSESERQRRAQIDKQNTKTLSCYILLVLSFVLTQISLRKVNFYSTNSLLYLHDVAECTPVERSSFRL